MLMSTSHPASAADQTNHIPFFNTLPNLNLDFRLVPETTVNAPAVVDDRSVAAHRQRPGKNDHTVRRGCDGQPFAAAEIQAGMEGLNLLICPFALVNAPVAVARGETIRETGWRLEHALPIPR